MIRVPALRCVVLPSFALLLGVAMASAVRAAEPRAVLELFTSQGCASCPAADALAGEIARDPSMIVLTLPVPYWDYLGWKDTLALKAHSQRQRAYATARGDRQVYTPQVVVNGLAHALGSDRAAIELAIKETHERGTQPLTLPVKVSVTGEELTVELPAAAKDKDRGRMQGEVWLCPLSHAVPVKIARGENRGRTVTYTNVVRRWIKLGAWDGEPGTFTLPRKEWDSGDIDAVAVLVQGPAGDTPRAMIGAAQAALR